MKKKSTGPDSLGALASGIVDSVTPSDGGDSSVGVANILNDIGPACTRNANTFRETLAEITANSPSGVNEAALAKILHFFSDKGRGSDGSSLIGVSSALLGSLIPGRGNEASVDGWNVKTVVEVLEKDYGARDWAMVATWVQPPRPGCNTLRPR